MLVHTTTPYYAPSLSKPCAIAFNLILWDVVIKYTLEHEQSVAQMIQRLTGIALTKKLGHMLIVVSNREETRGWHNGIPRDSRIRNTTGHLD